MKNKILRVISAFLILFSFSGISLAQTTITKELEFKTQDRNEIRDGEFAQEIKEDGKTYKLNKIDYVLEDKEPVLEEKEISKKFKVATGETPAQILNDNGVEYKLVDGQALTNTQVTTYVDYDKAVNRDNIPKVKKYTVKNSLDENVEVECNLVNVVKRPTPTIEKTHIDIVFKSYNANVFDWQGVKVSKDTGTPLKGLEQQLLSSVGADSSNHKVLSTYWTGESYTNNEGILCRNARANVERSVYYYRANYAKDVNLNNEYDYVSTQQIAKVGEYNYTIKAVATYEQQSNVKIILATAAIGLLVLLIILILWVVAKRKKEEEKLN